MTQECSSEVQTITGDELVDTRLMETFAFKMKEAISLGVNCELKIIMSDKGFLRHREIGFPEVRPV